MFPLSGEPAETVAARGITAVHLSMSHDAGLATAYVIAEAVESAAPPAVVPALQPAAASESGAEDELAAVPAVIPALQPAPTPLDGQAEERDTAAAREAAAGGIAGSAASDSDIARKDTA